MSKGPEWFGCPSVESGKHNTCLCNPRCKVCGYGEHAVAHIADRKFKWAHEFQPKEKKK